MSRKDSIDNIGAPLPRNAADVLNGLPRASDVQTKPAAPPPTPGASVQARAVSEGQPIVDTPTGKFDMEAIRAVRKAKAKEYTLQRNYRMPVSLLEDMDDLNALGYEFSEMVVAGTREHVARLKKKHGLG